MWSSSLYSLVPFLVFLILNTFVQTVYTQETASEVSKFTFSEKCGEIQEIAGDPRTLIPWNVAIFRRSNAQSNYKFINAGVLLSNTTVLTVFGGVYGESIGNRRYHIPASESFLLAVGLNSTSLTTADRHTQTSKVSYIRPYRHQEEDNKIFHFWLYHLTDPIRLNTPYARTPCLPFFLSKLPNHWKLLHGGYTNPPGPSGFSEIKAKSSLVIPDKECDNIFRKNYGGQTASYVWCSRISPVSLKDETGDFCFNHGSVIVSGILNRYFLAGVTAAIPDKKKGRCTQETTYIHAKTINSIEWMFHNIRCGPNSFSCVNSTCIPLNEVCNHAQNCPDEDKSDEDPIFCQGQNQCRKGPETIQCGIKGSCIRPNQLCDGSVDCQETGGDEDQNFCFPPNPVNNMKRSSMNNFPLSRPPFQSSTSITNGRAQNFGDTEKG